MAKRNATTKAKTFDQSETKSGFIFFDIRHFGKLDIMLFSPFSENELDEVFGEGDIHCLTLVCWCKAKEIIQQAKEGGIVVHPVFIVSDTEARVALPDDL